MLIEQIRTDLITATKAKDTVTQRTLRSVIAAVQEAEVSGDEAVKLDDDGVQAVVKAQVKRRIDAAEAFASGGAADREAAEREELAILEGYLPAALTSEELEVIVSAVLRVKGSCITFRFKQAVGNPEQIIILLLCCLAQAGAG